ncbi:MAG: hypothetical protein WBX15_03795 [Thermoanaerobaculia bacterium]
MKLTGRIVDGQIRIESDAQLPEGASVEINVIEPDEAYELNDEEDEEIWQAQLELRRGEGIPAEDVLKHRPSGLPD